MLELELGGKIQRPQMNYGEKAHHPPQIHKSRKTSQDPFLFQLWFIWRGRRVGSPQPHNFRTGHYSNGLPLSLSSLWMPPIKWNANTYLKWLATQNAFRIVNKQCECTAVNDGTLVMNQKRGGLWAHSSKGLGYYSLETKKALKNRDRNNGTWEREEKVHAKDGAELLGMMVAWSKCWVNVQIAIGRMYGSLCLKKWFFDRFV